MLLGNEYIKLRKLEPSDVITLYCIENDTQAWASGDLHNPVSQKDLQDYVDSSTGDIYVDKQLRLMIETSENKSQVVGCIDLYNFNPFDGKAGVGIYILEEYRRTGLATKAIRLIEEYAFNYLHLRMLYALVPSFNKASAHLFASANWQMVSILPQWLQSGDVYVYQQITPLLLQ